jgi:hypothetical protein
LGTFRIDLLRAEAVVFVGSMDLDDTSAGSL